MRYGETDLDNINPSQACHCLNGNGPFWLSIVDRTIAVLHRTYAKARCLKSLNISLYDLISLSISNSI